MSVFVWPASFRALAKCNQRGIDKDYGPTGHSGCAEKKKVALLWQLALKHIYLGTAAYAGTQWHTQTHSDTHAKAHGAKRGRLAKRQQGESQSPNIRSKCLTQLNPSDTLNGVGYPSTLHPGSSPDGTPPHLSRPLARSLCLHRLVFRAKK